MKTALIALLCAFAATAATAQLAKPVPPDPNAAHPPAVDPAKLTADREKVKGDRARLKAAKAAHDDGAVTTEKANLKADMTTWRLDRNKVDAEHGSEILKK